MLRKKPSLKKSKTKLNRLRKILRRYKGVIIALSGGVDSSLLTLISHEVFGDRAIAVTAHSPIHPREDFKRSQAIASQIKIKHLIIKTHELSNTSFVSNPVNRCYICKKMILRPVLVIARQYGYQVIEASNLDDLIDYRPGIKALKELSIVSPFIEAGMSKKDIRSLARSYGLFNWDQPSNACYATRIPYYQKIELKKIQRIAASEKFLRKFKIGQVRIRDHDPIARIELCEKFMPVVIKKRRQIINMLKKLGYKYITLDLEGYRTGSLNPGKTVARSE